MQKKQIALNIDSGDYATDRLILTILDAPNDYILNLARKQIQLAFQQSQKEVDNLYQRTREGIKTARCNVKQIGQRLGRKLQIKKKIPINKKLFFNDKVPIAFCYKDSILVGKARFIPEAYAHADIPLSQ